MNYKKNVPSQDIEKALSLEKTQIVRLKGAIEKAYNNEDWGLGPNIDNIYALIAPYIKSPEEAFYVANVVLTDIFGAMMVTGQKFGDNPLN